MAQADDPLIGRVIAERYLIRSAVGEGAMGSVYLADHIWLERPVAVKVVRSDVPVSARALRRLHREARAVARIRHPNVVGVFDYGETEERWPYLIMEFVEGQTASRFFRRCEDLRAILLAADGMLAGLGAAHACGVLHRDLKPANMLVRGGDPSQLVLLDFGIAAMMGEAREREPGPAPTGGQERLTHAGTVVGTPLYMSPEQAMGQEATPLSDIYSAGVVLYEWVSGETPFAGDVTEVLRAQAWSPPPPLVGRPGLPLTREVHDLIARALAKAPADRWEGAQAMRDEVGRCLRLLDVPSAESLPSGAVSALSVAISADSVPPLSDTLPSESIPRWAGSGREPPFVGRHDSLERIVRRVADAAQGAGAVLVVRGEPGLGKSRLVRQAVEIASSRVRALVAGAPCQAATRDALEPLRQLLMQLLDGGREGSGYFALESAVLPGGEPLLLAEPERRDLLAWLWPTDVSARPSPARRAELWEQCARVLSMRRPLLLWLDDVQDADAGTLAALERMAASAMARRLPIGLLVVWEERPGEERTDSTALLDKLGRFEGESVLTLTPGRLSPAETGALLAGLAPFHPELSRAIAAWSAGLPLLAVQIARHLLSSDRLVTSAEGLLPAGGVDLRGEVPTSLEAGLRAERDAAVRTAPHPEHASRILEGAALLGDSWDVDALAAVLSATGGPIDPDALETALDHLVGVGLFSEPRGGGLDRLAWDPALHRDALLRGLVHTRKGRRLGRAAADALLQTARLAPAARSRAVAELLLIAGDRETAAIHALAAGRFALLAGDIAEGERLLRVAEAPGNAQDVRGEARVLLGQAESRSGDPRRAADWFRRALEGPLRPELRGEAWLGVGQTLLSLGEPAAALPALQEARSAIVEAGAPVALLSRTIRAMAAAAADVPGAPMPVVDEDALLAAADSAETRAEVGKTLGVLADLQGRPKEAAQWFSRALEPLRTHGLRADQVLVLSDLGRMLRRCGEDAAAAGCLLEALELARDLGLVAAEAEAHNELGELARKAADWPAAALHYGRAEERWTLVRSDLALIATLNRAIVAAEAGAAAEARGALQGALDRERGLPPYLHAAWSWIDALVHAAAGSVDPCLAAVQRAAAAEDELRGAHDDAIDLLQRIAAHLERRGEAGAAGEVAALADRYRRQQGRGSAAST